MLSEKTNLNKAWRVAGYVRLSREDGDGAESDSIAAQRMLIRDWALRSGVELVAEYCDDGYTGATFERPGFAHMIEDARKGLFDTIAVKDLSRFGRSYLDCGSWIERELPRMGVRLFSIADGFDSAQALDYNQALLLPVKNLINEMQVMATSEKVRTSLAAKRARGECVANFAPYGYAKDPLDRHRLVVDEPAARVVRRIFELFLSNVSASSIAQMLNAEGVPAPSACKEQQGLAYRTGFSNQNIPRWHANTIMRILRNETYTGTLVQGKTRCPSWRLRTPVPVPIEEWQRTPNAHEAIIDEECFQKAQEAARRSYSRRILSVPINVHIICGGCKSPMKRMQVLSNGKRYTYYVCSAHRRDVSVCSPHSVREEALIAQLESFETLSSTYVFDGERLVELAET